MWKITFGNNYLDHEEMIKHNPKIEDLYLATVDFLDAYKSSFEYDGALPKDWFDTIFIHVEKENI